jgi:hypothetical protein
MLMVMMMMMMMMMMNALGRVQTSLLQMDSDLQWALPEKGRLLELCM